MALQLVQVNFKAHNDVALGQFWADALDWGVSSEGPGVANLEPRGFTWPDPSAVCIDIVAVPDPASVTYRAHLDLASTSAEHYAELLARLLQLGATIVGSAPSPVVSGAVSSDLAVGAVSSGAASGATPSGAIQGGPWTVLADPEGNVFRVREPQERYSNTGPIAAIVVDCSDPRELARFWGAATDWTVHEVSDGFARLRSAQGVGPYLEFVRSTEAHDPHHRVHLDLLPYPGDDQAEAVAKLKTLGATESDIGQGDVPWMVLADPEGNEFCVLKPR